jgi:hypothetical protein
MWRRLISILARPYTFFAAPDVFISYARRDGASYAEAIAAFLADAKHKFSCHIDQWDTAPGVRVPATILRAARRCHAAVIVGSPAALASEAVHAEVKELTASKRTIVVIELLNNPISTAVWYPLIKGLAFVPEAGDLPAVMAGKPSQNVLNRLENAFTFWRRNRRIQSAAWAGATVLVVAAVASVIFSQQAAKSRNVAQATEKSIRAQDMSSRDPAKSRAAMRLAMESMAIEHTSWGESTLRRALLLMPSYQGSHTTKPVERYYAVPRRHPSPARIDGSGKVVTWSYIEGKDSGEPVFKVSVTDARTGNSVRPEFEVKGMVTDLHLFDTTFVVETTGFSNSGAGLVWARKNESAVASIPKKGRSLAISPDGSLAAVINDDVELWSLGEEPATLRRWPLPGISSAAFSVDTKLIYAIRNAELIVFSAETANAEPKLLSKLEWPAGDGHKRLFATTRHLAVQVDSKVRIWSIAKAKWVHEIDSQVDSEVVLLPGDRLADWSSSRAVISDLSAEDGVGFHFGTVAF